MGSKEMGPTVRGERAGTGTTRHTGPHRRWGGAGLLVVLMLVMSSAGLAGAHGGDTGQVHGCVNAANGNVRIVGPDQGCKNNESAVDWSQTDTDTTYQAGDGLSLDPASNSFSVVGAPWGGLTDVPAGFADGLDHDTTYSGGDFATSGQGCSGTTKVTGIDAAGQVTCGADIDTNTTYSGADFARSNQGCAANQYVTAVNGAGGLQCGTPQSSGTQLYAAQRGSAGTDRIELAPVAENQTCCQFPVTTLLSVNVPAGTYLVTSSLELINNANFAFQDNSRDVGCGINTTFFDAYWLDIAGGNARESVSPQSVITLPSGGTIALQCAVRNGGTDRSWVEAATRSLAALKVDPLG